MDYVASDELGNLFRLGFVLDMHFTYAVQLVQDTIILLMFNVPSMTYVTAGPCAGTGTPGLSSLIAANK